MPSSFVASSILEKLPPIVLFFLAAWREILVVALLFPALEGAFAGRAFAVSPTLLAVGKVDHDTPLADKYIFAHGHDTSWHYQGDFFDALESLLDSAYFRKMKYGGVFRGQYASGAWGENEEWWARPLYKYVFANTSMPPEPVEEHNQRPCCATFWLNSELVRNRKKEEYIEMRDKLRQWSRTHQDANPDPAWYCGRTMEYNWHIIFTKKAYVDRCHLCQGE